MNILVSEIFAEFSSRNILTRHRGADPRIFGIASVQEGRAGDLVFMDDPKYLEMVSENRPSAVVTDSELSDHLAQFDEIAVLVAPNVKMAHALLRQRYVDRDLHHTEWPRIHPSAVIHDSVQIPEDAVIGPGVVIGRGVKIGSKVVIMANAVIEYGVIIGESTVVYPGGIVGYDSEIGARVFLKSGCVIGSEGFGFAQDEHRRSHRIPHGGKVVIEDDVVIGPNCTIDRATYRETRIGAGCKLDGLCHVGHNASLDEDCILVAQTGISGSTRLGKRVICSGQTGMLGHLTVADDTVLVHRAGVTSSITEPGMYASIPVQPFKEYTRNIAVFQRLAEVWKRLRGLEKKVAKLAADQD